MSNVPAESRKKTPLQAIVNGRTLCKHTLHILANNKVFRATPTGDAEEDAANPPQPELVAKIRETTLDAYMAAYAANNTPFTADNYRHRRQLQDKSISKLNDLLALIELAAVVFHLPGRRVHHWTDITCLVRNQTQAWKESDYGRYRRLRAKGR